MTIKQSAIDNFTDQFDDSTELQELANALHEPSDELEGLIGDLETDRWVASAVGKQLDRIGAVVGVSRQGRNDSDYRSRIRFQIFINTSNGNPEDIIRATRVLTDGTDVRYWELYPAAFQLFTNGPATLNVSTGTVDNFLLTTDDGGLLEVYDGDTHNLQVSTLFSSPTGLLEFLRQISPVAIGNIAVTFTLGKTPIFGFGGDFVSFLFKLDDDELFELENGDNLQLTDTAVAQTGGFQGFAELIDFTFRLENGDPLEITTEEFENEVVELELDDGEGLLLDSGFVLGVQIEVSVITTSNLEVFDVDQAGQNGGMLAEALVE